jgi:hypothetical protein
MVLVKPATVIHWHRQGFRLFWRWRKVRTSIDRARSSKANSRDEQPWPRGRARPGGRLTANDVFEQRVARGHGRGNLKAHVEQAGPIDGPVVGKQPHGNRPFVLVAVGILEVRQPAPLRAPRPTGEGYDFERRTYPLPGRFAAVLGLDQKPDPLGIESATARARYADEGCGDRPRRRRHTGGGYPAGAGAGGRGDGGRYAGTGTAAARP